MTVSVSSLSNGAAQDYYIKGKKYNSFEVPFFAMLVDYPIFQWKRLQERKNPLTISCIDHSHVNFLSHYLNRQSTQTFLPHGGC